jgi:hypothetical protein
VEVPGQVQIAKARSRYAEMPGLSRIKPLKENNKGRIWWIQKTGLKRKAPPFGGTFLIQLNRGSELAITIALTRLIGILSLTVRILLLLSGLLATALLLTRLLPWILVLLARILVLIGHRDLPC